jgi:UDP-3-O-[3-hydroxymyristoyl] glucosamine N-acyltransferase
MTLTSAQIAELTGGRLLGKSDVPVTRLAEIEHARVGDLSFLSNPKYLGFLETTEASVLIVSHEIAKAHQMPKSTLVAVDDPYSAFSKCQQVFSKSAPVETGIHPLSYVSEGAQIGEGVSIGAFAFIAHGAQIGSGSVIMEQVYIGAGVKIGNDSRLNPGVRILHDCEVGNHCVIHSNTVVGSDGFGFAPQKEGHYDKVAQNGVVIIEDYVEIGACCTIDRATISATCIRKGVKLDNLVHIAHNVEVGSHTVIAAQTGVSGSTHIDQNCVVAGQVGFAGHVYVAPGSQIGGQTGVTRSLTEPGLKWNGTPVGSYMESQRQNAVIRRLPELMKRLEELETRYTNKDNNP